MSRDGIVISITLGIMAAIAGVVVLGIVNINILLWVAVIAVGLGILFVVFMFIADMVDEAVPDDAGKPKPDKEGTDF